jgi:hypothetical protein
LSDEAIASGVANPRDYGLTLSRVREDEQLIENRLACERSATIAAGNRAITGRIETCEARKDD